MTANPGREDLPQRSFHEHLDWLIKNSPRKQKEIAKEVGYERPHIISLFKSGDTKVPLGKVPALARALDADPKFLLRFAMHEYMPEVFEVIEETFGTMPTANETEILRFIRAGTADSDPPLTEPSEKAMLRSLADALLENEVSARRCSAIAKGQEAEELEEIRYLASQRLRGHSEGNQSEP